MKLGLFILLTLPTLIFGMDFTCKATQDSISFNKIEKKNQLLKTFLLTTNISIKNNKVSVSRLMIDIPYYGETTPSGYSRYILNTMYKGETAMFAMDIANKLNNEGILKMDLSIINAEVGVLKFFYHCK